MKLHCKHLPRYIVTRNFGRFVKNQIVEFVSASVHRSYAEVNLEPGYEPNFDNTGFLPWDAMEQESI